MKKKSADGLAGWAGCCFNDSRVLKFELAALLCIIGMFSCAGFTLFFPKIFDQVLSQKLALVDGTPAYDVWKEPTDPVYLKIYMFHVVNPDDISQNIGKPLLKQIGPYVFREREQKCNIQHHAENFTSTYQVKKTWHFVPELSNGTLEDYVTTLNVPVVASQESKRGDYWTSLMLDAVYSSISATLFVNKTVGELLFEGYEDTLLSIAELSGAKTFAPMDKFGFFYKRNGTLWGDGVFNVFTGEDDATKIGKINTWNGKSQTQYEGQCGEIRGSASGFFPPNLEEDSVELYSHQVCRTLTYVTHGEIDYVQNMPGIVYELPVTTFANKSVYPPNWCFENNLPSGVLNATYCKEDKSPLFISFPHFYGADPYFISKFHPDSDFAPSKEKHASRMVLLPKMGIPMEVTMRFQINMRIHPNPSITLMQDVPSDLYLPTIWFEGIAMMSPESGEQLETLLDMPRLVKIGGSIMVVCCLVGVIISVLLNCSLRAKTSKKSKVVLQAFEAQLGCEIKLLNSSSTDSTNAPLC